MTMYTASERSSYEPPPCPNDPTHRVEVDWVKTQSLAAPEPLYVPGTLRCRDCPPGTRF